MSLNSSEQIKYNRIQKNIIDVLDSNSIWMHVSIRRILGPPGPGTRGAYPPR